MSPERWRRVEELFETAAAAPTKDRTALLERETSGDLDLRREVERLLAADDSAGDLEIASLIGRAAGVAASGAEMAGRRLGPYRIDRLIGQGGMSAVYLGSRADDHYRKEVAIKILTIGSDPDRFRRERQILAQLDHPYIARLIDGGSTPEGMPYLVMEYVEGQTLSAYPPGQTLDIPARCRLFRKICEAVSYAHRNLVVHRDIKPDNIIVTPAGEPKLLDFGIAKLLDQSVTKTSAALTPAYASPEQIRGLTITTASDVYSLGIVLYELLTGRSLYSGGQMSPYDTARRILEDDPPAPSSAGKQLRGDLDNIVLMAIRKEPERRYASVEQFSEDIRRHLEGLPVLARHNSAAYRAGKFARRNWLAVTAASLAVMALAATAGVAVVKAREAQEAERAAGIQRKIAERRSAEAEQARLTAETRLADVRQMAETFLYEFDDSIRDLAGASPARRKVVATSLRYLDKLSAEAAGDERILRDVAEGYGRTGDLQGNPLMSNIGDIEGAEKSYRKAMDIWERLTPATPEDWRNKMLALARMGDISAEKNDSQAADRYYTRALALPPAAMRGEFAVLWAIARAHVSRGDLYEKTQRGPAALADFRTAFSISTSLVATQQSPALRMDVANVGRKMGRVLQRQGRIAEAIPYMRAALVQSEALLAGSPASSAYQRGAMAAARNLGFMLLSEKDAVDEAERLNERALKIGRERLRQDPSDAQAMVDMGATWMDLGDLLERREQFAKAAEAYRNAMEGYADLRRRESDGAQSKQLHAMSQLRVANALGELKEYGPALDFIGKAVAILAELVKTDPKNLKLTGDMMQGWHDAGSIHFEMKNWRKSIEANTKAAEIAAAMLAADAGQMFIVRYSSFVYAELGDAYKAAGDCNAAAAWWGKANAHFERLKTTNQLNAEARADYAKMPGRFRSCAAAPLPTPQPR